MMRMHFAIAVTASNDSTLEIFLQVPFIHKFPYTSGKDAARLTANHTISVPGNTLAHTNQTESNTTKMCARSDTILAAADALNPVNKPCLFCTPACASSKARWASDSHPNCGAWHAAAVSCCCCVPCTPLILRLLAVCSSAFACFARVALRRSLGGLSLQ
jgi:hypothetical protein